MVALGISAGEVPVSDKQRAALYRSLLASREVLIVLDNAASSAQVEPQARHQAGSRWGEADALARRGRVLNMLDQTEDARRSCAAAAAMYEQLHDPRAADIRAYLRNNSSEPVLPPPAW